MWNRNMDILAKGYFLVSREAFRVMKRQKLGGAMVFVASKNGLAASVNASAYSTAKAAEIHLARSLALEGAPLGIRVNVVNPDAVLRGSKIWTGEWKEQRAAAYNMQPDDLEALSPAQPAEAKCAAGRCRRGDILPGLGLVGEIDRQHHQRRRWQRAEFHALNRRAGGTMAAGPIDASLIAEQNRRHEKALTSDYEASATTRAANHRWIAKGRQFAVPSRRGASARAAHASPVPGPGEPATFRQARRLLSSMARWRGSLSHPGQGEGSQGLKQRRNRPLLTMNSTFQKPNRSGATGSSSLSPPTRCSRRRCSNVAARDRQSLEGADGLDQR
jgi:hypothetical protein